MTKLPPRRERILKIVPFAPDAISAKEITAQISKEEGKSVGESAVGRVIADMIHRGQLHKRKPSWKGLMKACRKPDIRIVYFREAQDAPSRNP